MEITPVVEPEFEITEQKPLPITDARLVSKKMLKRIVASHGLQLGSDFYRALNARVMRLTLDAMSRMFEDGYRVRLGVEDL